MCFLRKEKKKKKTLPSREDGDVLLGRRARLLYLGLDLVRRGAERKFLQQVEVVHPQVLSLRQRTKDLTRDRTRQSRGNDERARE